MVKIRSITKSGVTAKFSGGRFIVMHHGKAEFVAVETVPANDTEIMQTLSGILDRH
jgi:hypothetical protein